MRSADFPPDEPERLERLKSYDILDTPPEKAFDDVVDLAAHICEVPIALVSIVDHSRQWFKARRGLDVSETDRDIAFCPHAMLQREGVFEISDAFLDDRFSDNPLVSGDPNIRFYAGAPLVSPDGHALGTVCVIDRRSRKLSDKQKELLQKLSRQVVAQLELRRHITAEATIKEELRRSRDEAQAASRAKSEFLATMSHEIRTPLNAVLGVADLLRDSGLSDEQIKLVNLLQRSGEHLLELINDVLDMTRIEAGHVERLRRDFDPADLVRRAAEIYEMRAREAGLDFFCTVGDNVPATVSGDPGRLRQVLINLVGNAIKFTKHGEVRVELTLEPGKPDQLMFSVRDTGPGVSEEFRKSIFEPFTRADTSSTRSTPGTGLGLAISRRLVELMGGRVDLESREGAGSHFYFRVPALEALGIPASVDSERVPKTEDGSRNVLEVLVVDDNPDNLMLLEAYLKGTRHRCTYVSNAGEAIRVFEDKVNTGTFDVVFMDIQMSGMDGLDATRELRRIEAQQLLQGGDPGARSHIFALTAHAFREDIERSLEAGCDAHITKPISRNDLLDALRSAGG